MASFIIGTFGASFFSLVDFLTTETHQHVIKLAKK